MGAKTMMRPRPVLLGDSGTIQGRLSLDTSGATMTQVEPIDPDQLRLDRAPARRFSCLRGVAIATMLPFAAVEELLSARRRYAVETVNRYVVFLDEEEQALSEFPSVFAFQPHRQTVLFPANSPIPLLGYRSPFISRSSLVTEEE